METSLWQFFGLTSSVLDGYVVMSFASSQAVFLSIYFYLHFDAPHLVLILCLKSHVSVPG